MLPNVSDPENCSFTATRALCFTPILHSLFHSIPPTVLPGKHYWPHDTDEDIESWEAHKTSKLAITNL